MQGEKAIWEDVKVFEKYYKFVRIVDPLQRKVISPEVQPQPVTATIDCAFEVCHDIWKTGKVCTYCVAQRAAEENEPFVKVEMVDNKIFMVIALPIKHAQKTLVMELLKEITHNHVFSSMTGEPGSCKISTTTFQETIFNLNESIIKDELTGIFNRKFINDKLPAEIIKALVEKNEFAVALADIDHFKKINDEYGHIIGDEVLKAIALELSQQVRQSNGDWVARYGGEEFLIFLSGAQFEEAGTIIERLRQAVEALEIVTTAGTLKITASFGVYIFKGETADLTAMLSTADENLYRAKVFGRNCVVGA